MLLISDVNNKKKQIICTQIAGILARRIVWSVEKNQKVTQGNRYGIICFGSRVDVFIPCDCFINVKSGQKVYGGVTSLASWGKDNEEN